MHRSSQLVLSSTWEMHVQKTRIIKEVSYHRIHNFYEIELLASLLLLEIVLIKLRHLNVLCLRQAISL